MLEYIESWSRTHHNKIRCLDCQNCRNHTDTRTGKPEEHSHGHGGGHNNNQQQQVPGGVGGKFGAQAAGAFSNYMGGKVQHPRFSSAMRSVKVPHLIQAQASGLVNATTRADMYASGRGSYAGRRAHNAEGETVSTAESHS
ncbi:hypothetical protein CF319_g8962 [Tilletia indica]|nr:hypothetical protein CF319_g8962 [Tilletia indica]